MSLSEVLGSLISTDWRERFTAPQREALTGSVRTAFVDTAACILAGRDEEPTRVAARWATHRYPARPEASLLFGEQRMAGAGAALVNAVAAHTLDYDDAALAGHPSAVLMPVLWAEHERTGIAGFALVQAYAKGYAVWGELQRRQHDSLHARGWHPSAVFGVIASAAAASSLRGLNAQHIAASMAGGVIANFGSMTKALHLGLAADGGMAAAELAQAGMTASADALDGKAGLLSALVGPQAVDLASAVPESLPFTLLNLRPGIKKYPVCYAAHRVVDGVMDLMAVHRLAAGDVAGVDATISETTAAVLRHHHPENPGEARFSMEFILATVLRHGRLGIEEVTEQVLAEPAVRDLMRLVRTHSVTTSCPIEPSFAFTDRVTVTLKNGTMLDSGPIRFARGHSELPLTPPQLLEKLRSCAGREGGALAGQVVQRIDAALHIGS